MKRIILLSFVFLLHQAFAQMPLQKIQAELLEEVAEKGQTEFLIILQKQAALSKAELFLRKEDKTRYVARQLRLCAERSQKNVIALLEKSSAPYHAFYLINAIWAKGELELMLALARLPEVRELQTNPKVNFRSSPTSTGDKPNQRAPEWGITQIQADQVWNLGYKGQGVVVGGQDTGVEWDHAAIKNQYRGWNGSTADHNYNWHDAIHSAGGSNPCGSDSPVPCDDHDHGTHTVGTMVGDDGGTNQIGVAPDAKWIACRNMDQGVGSPSTYIECFEWFLEPTDLNDANPDPAKAPDVINNSWSCPPSEGCNSGNFATMEAVVNNLVAAGIVVVVSAGNSGPACSTVNAPAAIFENSFTVGATNNNDDIAYFSSRGPVTVDNSNRLKPDICAPGVGVRSCVRNGQYATWSGTSMAGPHVVGTVALMLDARPDMKGQVATIENLIEQNALQLTSSQDCGGTPGSNIPNNTYGHGRVNALASVNAILALPVELISFTAECSDKGSLLQWETAWETNFSHFLLLRSSDLEIWEIVGQIPENSSHSYQLEDRTQSSETHYYRLQMFDVDGKFEYSKVIVAHCPGTTTQTSPLFRLSPNPANHLLNIHFSGTPPYSLRLYSSQGEKIWEIQDIQNQDQQIRIAELPSGCYLLQLTSRNRTETQKIIHP